MPDVNGIFKYYLFKKNGEVLEINASNVPMDDFLSKNYPSININNLGKDNKVLLFNALFDNNSDLMYQVIEQLNSNRKRNKYIYEEFDYVALLAADSFSHDFGFLCYGNSNKSIKNREKLIPIIYRDDLYSYGNNKTIDLDDLKDPYHAVTHLFSDVDLENDVYSKKLEELLRSILSIKFKSNLPYTDPDFVGRDFGFEEFTSSYDSLIHNSILREKYQPSSSLWINLLVIFNYFNRVKRIAHDKGINIDFIDEYQNLLEVKASRSSYKSSFDYKTAIEKAKSDLASKVNPYDLARCSIFSQTDVVKGRKKNDSDQMTISELEQSIVDEINKTNLSEDSYYTIGDFYDNPDIYNYLNGNDSDTENMGRNR